MPGAIKAGHRTADNVQMKASRLSASLLQAALEDAGALVLVASDTNDNQDVVSGAHGCDALGFAPSSTIGLRLAHALPLKDPADLARLLAVAREQPDTAVRAFDVALNVFDGHERWVDLIIRSTRSGRNSRTIIATAVDVTERHRIGALAADQAARDPLTDLPNGRRFVEHLDSAIHRSRRSGEHLAILYVDLERFRQVNEAFGTSGGDIVLRTTALRLREALRAEDIVARVHADQFAVLLAGLEAHLGRGYAVDVVDRLTRNLSEPIEIGGTNVRLEIAVGVAHRSAGRNDPSASDLLAEARAGMDQVKQNGRRWKELRSAPGNSGS